MGTQVGVGVSRHRNPDTAGKEAVAQALTQANITHPDFVMLFATVGYRQSMLLKSVREATHKAPLIGCSGAGVIAQGVTDESNFAMTVVVFKSDEMSFTHGMATGIRADVKNASVEVGEAVGAVLDAHTDAHSADVPAPKALFLFLEGISSNFDAFMEGLRSRTTLEQTIPAIGGFAGDNVAIKETFQYFDDQVVNDGAVWALLSGEVRVASVLNHGCIPLGEKHTVTKSDRNTVYEVDHLPVLEALEGFLSKSEIDDWSTMAVVVAWALESKRQPMSSDPCDEPRQSTSSEADSVCIRSMVSKNEQAGTVDFFSDIPEGSNFWIARRDQEKICAGAERMVHALLAKIGNHTPKLLFQVECVGRGKLILREHGKQALINSLQSQVGLDIPWVGLYAFAEIGPLSGHNQMHNFTGILTALY